MAARGPDGNGTEIRGPVGIGQQQMVTTPEGRHESIPEATDRYLLTADARIDNRGELEEILDVDGDPVVTDADLVLAAYDRWGRDCPERLVGAFAFAIWDGEKEQLFCARDHAGLRPFFYTATSDVFAFASETGALLQTDFVSEDIDEQTIGDYLLGFTEQPAQTFYVDVRALPPAHSMVVGPDGVETDRYWTLDGPELDLDSVEEYEAEFRARFEEAIRARLRTPDDVRVGSYLSGGLDSTAISCLANSIVDAPLPTFSLTFDGISRADEREFIDAVHQYADFEPHVLPGEEYAPFDHADEILERMSGPFAATTLYLRWELNRAAENEGVQVLLDGFGGDQTVSRGLARFPELLRTGHPMKLLRETRLYARRYDKSPLWVLYRRVLTPIEPDGIRRVRRRLFGSDGPLVRRSNVIDEEFATRHDLRRRVRELESHRRSRTRPDHRRILGGGKQANGCELSNLSAIQFGIEPRFPFLDRRLMEFCFRCPGHLKFRNGWRRWLLRSALSDELPPMVRDRTTKGAPGAALFEAMRTHDRDVVKDLAVAEEVPDCLDGEKVQAASREFLEGNGSNAHGNVWRPALLCRWYR